MNLVDRYLFKYTVSSDAHSMGKKQFQLLSLTALYVAIKLDGHFFLSIDHLTQLGRGRIRKEEIVQMEQDILFRLDWYVHPPTSYVFLRHYLLLLQPAETQSGIWEVAKFYLELSVLDYQFVRHRPSLIAMAALLNAIQDELPGQFSKYFAMMSLLSTAAPNDDHMKTVQKCRKRLYCLFWEGPGWDETSSSESHSTCSSTPTNNHADQ